MSWEVVDMAKKKPPRKRPQRARVSVVTDDLLRRVISASLGVLQSQTDLLEGVVRDPRRVLDGEHTRLLWIIQSMMRTFGITKATLDKLQQRCVVTDQDREVLDNLRDFGSR